MEVIDEKGFAKTSVWLAASPGTAVLGMLGHLQGLRLNPFEGFDWVMGVSCTLRLDLTHSGGVECSGYQPNGILEGSKEPAILYEFSTWDMMNQFLCSKMNISLVSQRFSDHITAYVFDTEGPPLSPQGGSKALRKARRASVRCPGMESWTKMEEGLQWPSPSLTGIVLHTWTSARCNK